MMAEEAKQAPDPGYRESTWAGKPKYDCGRCAFDTTSLRAIRDHVRMAHNRLPVAQEDQVDEEASEAPADEPKKVVSGKAGKAAEGDQ